MKENEFIYGIHAVAEALRTGRTLDKVLIKKGLKGEKVQELQQELRDYGTAVQKVPQERLDRITRNNHQGVVAFISPVAFYNIEELVQDAFEKGEVPFVVLLDGVTDVRNFGAVVRSSLAAGAHAVVVPGRKAARVNADAIKTSAGALHRMPVCKVQSMRDTVQFLKKSGLTVLAATEDAPAYYYEQSMTGPVALLLGSEEDGIAHPNLKACNAQVKIPILGEIESLNVSVAASVLAYEVVRQRMSSN